MLSRVHLPLPNVRNFRRSMQFISPLWKKGSKSRTKMIKGTLFMQSEYQICCNLTSKGLIEVCFLSNQFFQVQSSSLNDKMHYFFNFNGICPINFNDFAICKFSKGWSMRSAIAILFNFDKNLSLIIIHHPVKFHNNS